jgi:hypothetical protein
MRHDNHLLKHLHADRYTRKDAAFDVMVCVVCGASLALILFLFLV